MIGKNASELMATGCFEISYNHTVFMGPRNLASLAAPPWGKVIQPTLLLLWDPSLPPDRFVHAVCTRPTGVVLGSWVVLKNVRVGKGLTITELTLASPPPSLPIPPPPKERRLVVAPPLYRNLK